MPTLSRAQREELICHSEIVNTDRKVGDIKAFPDVKSSPLIHWLHTDAHLIMDQGQLQKKATGFFFLFISEDKEENMYQ